MKNRSDLRTNREGGAPAKTRQIYPPWLTRKSSLRLLHKDADSVSRTIPSGWHLGRAEAKRGDDIGAGGVGIGVLIFLTHVNAFAP